MSDTKRSSEVWMKDPEFSKYKILDPDGWNRSDFKNSWNELINREEFMSRLMKSTVQSDTKRGWEEIFDKLSNGEYKGEDSILYGSNGFPFQYPESMYELDHGKVKDFIRTVVIPQAKAEERRKVEGEVLSRLYSSNLSTETAVEMEKVMFPLTPHKEDNA